MTIKEGFGLDRCPGGVCTKTYLGALIQGTNDSVGSAKVCLKLEKVISEESK